MYNTNLCKYQTEYYPDGDRDMLLLGASILYDYRPYLRGDFTDKREFLETVLDEMDGYPLIACFQDDTYVGAVCFTPPRRDVHHTGAGRSILSMNTVPGRSGVFKELLRALGSVVRTEGGKWMSIPHRLTDRTVKITYRSV